MRDGAALSLGSINLAVGGRLPSETLDALRDLLESDELRREVSELDDESCDYLGFIKDLQMGTFRIYENQPCVALVKTPTVDELNELLDGVLRDGITEPLGPGEPELQPILVEDFLDGKPNYRIEIARDGTAVVTQFTGSESEGKVEGRQLDALRMICAGELCESPESPENGDLVTIGDRAPIAVQHGLEPGACLAAIAAVKIAKDAAFS